MNDLNQNFTEVGVPLNKNGSNKKTKNFLLLVVALILFVTAGILFFRYYKYAKKALIKNDQNISIANIVTSIDNSIQDTQPTLIPVSKNGFEIGKQYFYYYYPQPEERQNIYIRYIGLREYGLPDGTKRKEHAFVSPERTDEDSMALLTDEFIACIKPEYSQSDLEELNKKFQVIIVKPMLSERTFVLSTKNNPDINALDMANIYSDEVIIEYAEPNWVHVEKRMM